MSIGKTRGFLYKAARILGDAHSFFSQRMTCSNDYTSFRVSVASIIFESTWAVVQSGRARESVVRTGIINDERKAELYN